MAKSTKSTAPAKDAYVYDPTGDGIRRWEKAQENAGNPDTPVSIFDGYGDGYVEPELPYISDFERERLDAWREANPNATVVPAHLLPFSYRDGTRPTPGWPFEDIPEDAVWVDPRAIADAERADNVNASLIAAQSGEDTPGHGLPAADTTTPKSTNTKP